MDPLGSIQTASKGITFSFIWKVFLSLLAVALLVGAIYWFVFIRGINWTTIKTLISQESAKAVQNPNVTRPVDLERVLMTGVQNIIDDPRLFLQAKDYSKNSGIAIERVLVNNALAMAKDFQYISTSI